ncbi:glycosyltransferase family 2 protein [Aerococcus sanguinicola]|uniref:glycosyltransferase family 2 protein n=1 Tax=unclassified Aerococcus TaxID=2618060 RepID=UPI0008A115FB|nr:MULTISPECIES: glycosyltransferase family 2 protein [unclassified Aerococcus]KAB0646413.1 glycosyltransferase family 2 protein [Aerococcus sanguinicola]MDK6233738.1 glycosyltransferase family 2 protein [Aerococcus sp. UMB10185]MDK6855907.1 glycosyltransferase family 2 protein [Aerococcus sp. UMB7533]OFN05642.1 glucosyl transferase family 2 [Aerococcus sp. HMSC062A02]OHO46144.1 glucosyl transferase family 2 [Aerococcus sp. HMSC035B07]
METISLIVPCFNEEEAINLFYQAVENIRPQFLSHIELEYVFVDDGSSDHTRDILADLARQDQRVHYLSFSRNFGKEAGIYAGLQHAKGDYVAIMDVDLQDPPELLPEMYTIIQDQAYDCVGTRRVSREGEPPIRSFFANLYYRLMQHISKTEIVSGARDFRLMTRQMVNAILEMTEYNRFSKGIFAWVGFKTKYLEYENIERSAGQTSWSFWSLFTYSIDGIVAFSEVPLDIISILGFFSFLAAILLAIFFAGRTLIFGNPTSGWTSLSVIILAMGGLQLLCLGVVGKYVGKTFLEVKHRPQYIIKETDQDLAPVPNEG